MTLVNAELATTIADKAPLAVPLQFGRHEWMLAGVHERKVIGPGVLEASGKLA